MLGLTISLLLIGVVGYIVSFAALSAESDNVVVSVINFACVIALVIGILLACNKVIEVECIKCESRRLESTSVKYCDVCGSELIPVNEK